METKQHFGFHVFNSTNPEEICEENWMPIFNPWNSYKHFETCSHCGNVGLWRVKKNCSNTIDWWVMVLYNCVKLTLNAWFESTTYSYPSSKHVKNLSTGVEITMPKLKACKAFQCGRMQQ